MLNFYEVKRIQDFASQRLSQREIAAKTGHSRRTIARVLSLRTIAAQKDSAKSTSNQRRECEVHFSVDYVRCADCGQLVKLPCLACRIGRLRELDHVLKAA